MIYRVEIRPEALDEISSAADWYDGRELGIGGECVREARAAIHQLSRDPLIYRVRRFNVRWFILPRFPYRVIYRVDDDLITILAFLHTSRHDGHWKNRI